MAIDYLLRLTDGDSFATYDIYYDSISVSNICSFTTGGTATNISYSELLNGVSVVVPDSASQLIVESNGTCQNYLYLQITPYVPTIEPPNLCLEYINESKNSQTTVRITFTPNGTLNGKTTWTGVNPNDNITYTIRWNLTANQWEVYNGTVVILIFPNNSATPEGAWISSQTYISKGTTTQGNCPVVSAVLINNLETVNTLCKDTKPCTGKIIVTATGGVPPYQYAVSFDPGNPNNVTWQSSNIIQGLCEGNFNVVVKDSLGTLSQPSQATISFTEQPVTYNVGLELISSTTYSNTYQPQREVSKDAIYRLVTDVPVPIGTTLNLRIQLTSTFSIYEPYDTYTFGFGLNFAKNGLVIDPTSQSNSSLTTPRNGCTSLNRTDSIVNRTYDFTYTNGDIIEINDSASFQFPVLTSDGCSTIMEYNTDCLIGNSSGIQITGCQCCSVTYDERINLINVTSR